MGSGGGSSLMVFPSVMIIKRVLTNDISLLFADTRITESYKKAFMNYCIEYNLLKTVIHEVMKRSKGNWK